MNNLKKIGLSALAGSLVATSVFAGTMDVTGDAKIEVQHNKGNILPAQANRGKAFSMTNSIYFNGGSTQENEGRDGIRNAAGRDNRAAYSVPRDQYLKSSGYLQQV